MHATPPHDRDTDTDTDTDRCGIRTSLTL